MLLCLVCLFDLACFFLPFFSSLIKTYSYIVYRTPLIWTPLGHDGIQCSVCTCIYIHVQCSSVLYYRNLGRELEERERAGEEGEEEKEGDSVRRRTGRFSDV